MDKSPVVLVGSHLGGSLAAWTQHKYPQMISGVWANGAPFSAADNLPGFLTSIRRFIRDNGRDNCLKALDEVFRTVKSEMQGETPVEYLEIFEMCPFEFEKFYDQTTFVYRLFTTITRSVLHNRLDDIADLCYELLDPEFLDVVEAFAPYFLSRQSGGSKHCLDFTFKQLVSDTSKSAGEIDVWAYQSCAEYGWFPGGPDNPWLFPNFFQFFCYNAFSLLNTERETAQRETQRLMDGILRNAEDNLILSYGALDPWSQAGISHFGSPINETGEKEIMLIQGTHSFSIVCAF